MALISEIEYKIRMRSLRQEPNREDLEELLKKLLHQNGLCLLIYP